MLMLPDAPAAAAGCPPPGCATPKAVVLNAGRLVLAPGPPKLGAGAMPPKPPGCNAGCAGAPAAQRVVDGRCH